MSHAIANVIINTFFHAKSIIIVALSPTSFSMLQAENWRGPGDEATIIVHNGYNYKTAYRRNIFHCGCYKCDV